MWTYKPFHSNIVLKLLMGNQIALIFCSILTMRIRADYKRNFKKIKIFQSKSHERHAEKRAMNHLSSYFNKISWDILIKVMVS